MRRMKRGPKAANEELSCEVPRKIYPMVTEWEVQYTELATIKSVGFPLLRFCYAGIGDHKTKKLPPENIE